MSLGLSIENINVVSDAIFSGNFNFNVGFSLTLNASISPLEAGRPIAVE
jgi:hypothetical protein